MGRLHDRIAIVSGGASGIGHAIVRRLAAEGATVEILDRSDAGSVAAETIEAGGAARAAICDVTDERQVADAVRAVAERHGRVDILVNNAGILIDRRPWHSRSRDEIEQFMRVNYVGSYLLTQAVHPLMKESSCGRIVMIGSRTALNGNPGMAGYVESKAAVAGLARVLARELGAEGITVNTVAPGMIATPGTRANSPEDAFDRATAVQAIKRRLQPDDVAALVAFLASDDAAMITGQTILCDGGGFLA
jgi:NAD(P)-dependent dehydrogenase (short-subunit alcohol dehydrogenase family)